MSKQFYNYLANTTVENLKLRGLRKGDRFNIRFENKSQIQALYNEFNDMDIAKRFSCENDDIPYNTACLEINRVRLIIATNLNGTTPDFLTFIRNRVGEDANPTFENTALLCIHDSDLDSLIGGSESLQKDGMPLSASYVYKDIANKLTRSELSEVDKEIVGFVMNRKKNNLFEDYSSVFEYQEILQMLNKNTVDKEDFKNSKMFFDPQLYETPTTRIVRDRLQDNYRLFDIVDQAHTNDNLSLLDKFFDDKGRRILEKEDWKDTSFIEILKSYESKKEDTPLKYEEDIGQNLDKRIVYWEKAEGTTAAKNRTRNIIVFNPLGIKTVDLVFTFDRILHNANLKVLPKSDSIVAATSGKRIKVKLEHQKDLTFFSQIRYKEDSATYKFNICTIEINEAILSDLKTRYSIDFKQKCIVVNSDEEIFINPDKPNTLTRELSNEESLVSLDEDTSLKLSKSSKLYLENSKYILVNIIYDGKNIPIGFDEGSVKPIKIIGSTVWLDKQNYRKNFYYIGENKLVHDTREFFAVEDYKVNLLRERQIVLSKGLFFIINNGEIIPKELNVSNKLKEIYTEILYYFETNNTLPSLCYIDEELGVLYKKYLNEFLNELDNISKGCSVQDIPKLGTIHVEGNFNEILYTPLHPLNVAFQLQIKDKLKSEHISEYIFKQLQSTNLLPYIYNGNRELYRPVEQNHSPEWKRYLPNKIPRYNGSKNYVSKLIQDKISEFTKHFSFLFELHSNCPIKINLINLGDCREFLQGIFSYYISKLDKANNERFLAMEVVIYNGENVSNAFEEISMYDNPELILNAINIEPSSDDYSADEIVNIFRSKVKVYSKSIKDKKYNYCHIAFYKLDTIEETRIYETMTNINTGVAIDGLFSGLTSMYLENAYKTGFGTKHLANDNNLIRLSKALNELAATENGMNSYKKDTCIVTAIMEWKKQDTLDKIYDSSHWVVFVEPKVDLNFFKNDPNSKDLLIIHYSDQYTSSSEYDAITVTRKSTQYIKIITEFLNDKLSVPINDFKLSGKIINLFNAINGDWLLRLIANNSQFPREKISILSAIKVCFAYLYHPNIIWTPISLEEIFRVSGATGLKSSEGLFSVKNLGGSGSYCDDVLFVGIEQSDEGLKVHYVTIEVKIGQNNTSTLNKAGAQINKTYELFSQFLTRDTDTPLKNQVFRNFLVQLIISSVEKMKIYDIWEEQNWNNITIGEIRSKLLNDDYTVSSDLFPIIGKGIVVSFKASEHFRDNAKSDDITYLKLFEEDSYNYLIQDIENIKNSFINGKMDFKEEFLVINSYNKCTTEVYHDDSTRVENIKSEAINEVAATLDNSNQPMEILFGENTQNHKNIYWYPTSSDKVMHTNTGIIGTMGTGKTQFTKSLIYQLHINSNSNVNRTPIGILIFDYKGDYIKDDFVSKANAKVYNLYHLPYNPLALFTNNNSKPLLPVHTANGLRDTIGYGI